MKPITTFINQTSLIKNIAHLIYSVENKDVILNDILEMVNKSNGIIASFLKETDSIVDKKVRIACRKVAIAQMFNAQLDYRSGYPYVDESAHGDEILFLKFKTTTAVVSKYGEILIDEGLGWINPRANYGPGWPIRSATDKKWGFIDNSGSILLPCIFDDVDQHIWEVNFRYNHVYFRLRPFGQVGNLNREDLEWLIEKCEDSRKIVCMNNDSIVFALLDLGNWDMTKEERVTAFETVSSKLSDIILSKEDLEKYL